MAGRPRSPRRATAQAPRFARAVYALVRQVPRGAELLEMEGVPLRGGRVDLARYRWSGPRRERHVDLNVDLPFSAGRRPGGRRPRGVTSPRS